MSRSSDGDERSAARPASILWTGNAEAVPLADVPCVAPADFEEVAVGLCSRGCRLTALSALPESGSPFATARGMLAVLADDQDARLGLVRTEVPDRKDYPALAASLPQAQAFEREIHETSGLFPAGHPWLKPLRRHGDLESLAGREGTGPPHPFFRVEGEGIHEVAVGPVHAGIMPLGLYCNRTPG